MRSTWLLAAAFVIGTVGIAFGGGGGAGGGGGNPGGGSNPYGGGMPSKQEIEKKVKEYLDGLPATDAEWQKIKITYKPVPSDPAEVIKGTGAVPAGGKADAAVKQYMPMAKPYIEKSMAEIGKLTNEPEFTAGKTKIVAGEYEFGIVLNDLTPVAIKISGKTLKAPAQVPLKATPAKTPYAKLAIEIKEGKKEGEFTIEVGFGAVLGTAKFQLAAAKK